MKVCFYPTKVDLARRTVIRLFGGLEDVQAGGDLIFVTLTDGYLIAKEIDRIAPDIVNLCDVYDIGPVYFEEVGADEFFFHVFQRAVGYIVLAGGDEFYVVAHAFEEEDIVLFQFDEFVLGFYEEEIGIGDGGRCRCCSRSRGRSGGEGFLGEVFDGFLEAFVSKGLFQVVVDMVLEGVEGVFGLGCREDDHGGVGEAVEQIKAGGAGHLHVEEEQVDSFPIEEFKGICYIEKMSFYLDEVALLTELAEKIRSDLDVLYYNTR